MFEMMKPMLVIWLTSAATIMEKKAKELTDSAHVDLREENYEICQRKLTRAGFWLDAADMIRESIAS